MSHLIETIHNTTIDNAINLLTKTHSLIVEQVIEAQKTIGENRSLWGIEIKRMEVSLPLGSLLIGKNSEKFVEIINILATTERTISALKWFVSKYPDSIVRECHSSTSDIASGNDIVLVDHMKNVVALCEVTDVISSSASQNGKEKKDLKNLGCTREVPKDSISRFIATSNEFATALTSCKRKWGDMHYRYIKHESRFKDSSVLLEIISANPKPV